MKIRSFFVCAVGKILVVKVLVVKSLVSKGLVLKVLEERYLRDYTLSDKNFDLYDVNELSNVIHIYRGASYV